jgi:predicted Zn-dependent protease with MMP-like domain
MNYTTPPGLEDLKVLVDEVMEILPDEILEYTDDTEFQIEDFPDEVVEQEYDLEDPYEMLALYRSGKELSPGVELKTTKNDNLMILYRRPILDVWCDTCDDLASIVRQAIIEEIGRQFDFSDDEIDEMVARHHQGMF